MKWKIVGRPGYFGHKRNEIISDFDNKYGKGNWRIVWKWKDNIIPFKLACQLYEDAYYNDSFTREGIWYELRKKAKNVYDHEESDIDSEYNYELQKGTATHIQDIAVRRVFLRRGWNFQGEGLIQIRGISDWGRKFSPGKIPFHLPNLISKPHLKGWWKTDSIEDFYQSNKLLQNRI